MTASPSVAPTGTQARARYEPHLRAAAQWLAASERPSGGSAAQYTPILGWSASYPETTGYIIPTLLQLARRLNDPSQRERAIRMGEWLLSIQNADGSWNGGKHPSKSPKPSVFNTCQILKGMLALWHETKDQRWIDAAVRANAWLSSGMNTEGTWHGKDYRSASTPSYYTHALWPMLAVAVATNDTDVVNAAQRGIRHVITRRTSNGAFTGWAFAENAPAFTHTIAYTIRGIQESGRLLNDTAVQDSVTPALELLLKRSELCGGRLPGAFDSEWKPAGTYVCLTGNAQLAKCLLIWEERAPDLRVVSAAARLVDVVCSHQKLSSPLRGIRGAVGGSAPIHGAYMRFRYPNWAAKYLCDALMALTDRLDRKG